MQRDDVAGPELRGLTLAIDRSVSFTHVPGDVHQRYARCSHPTALALERDIAALEYAEACRVTSSGMAAITAVLMAVCRPGTTIFTHTVAYSGTLKLISRLAAGSDITECTREYRVQIRGCSLVGESCKPHSGRLTDACSRKLREAAWPDIDC